MLRKLDAHDVECAKADAVRVDRQRLVERLRGLLYGESDSRPEVLEQKKTWNLAIGAAIREVES